jgi:FAD/FMN-containing dehydrogenase
MVVGRRISRRRFLTGATALGALACLPACRVPARVPSCDPPPGFPPSIPLVPEYFENWSREIALEPAWTCAPRTPADVVTIVNWAWKKGYKIRARGAAHTWSPLIIARASTCAAKVVLLDTTRHLTSVTIAPGAVTAETGVRMETLLTRLEEAGYGLTAVPAPGDVTLGGVLAVGAHGTAVRAAGEVRIPRTTYGSLSNLVLSVTAVVWDATQGQYVLRTFLRSDPQSSVFLAHIGRAFVTEVTLEVGANHRLRCQSYVNIPERELFASPEAGAARTLAGYIERTGRAEAIWFPFTEKPWLKVWTRTSTRPHLSRHVRQPFNYPFSDTLPPALSDLASKVQAGAGALTPLFGQTQYDVVAAGLAATLSYDLWGWSKDVLLYVRPTTLRITANGYAVLARRRDIQRIVSDFTAYYRDRLAAYATRDQYPMNGPVEIRVTGLDVPSEVDDGAAAPPALSAVRPRPDHPEWDVAVWLDVLTIPGTPYANQLYQEIETWLFSRYADAAVRPEWSKGWAFTDRGAWTSESVLTRTIPDAYRAGQMAGDDWDWAVATLAAYDPHRIFSNEFLDRVF